MSHEATLGKLTDRFGPEAICTAEFRDNLRVTVEDDLSFLILQFLKESCGFDMLADLTAVDYLHYPEAKDRYGVVYCLTNTATGERIVVKTMLNDPDPALPTCVPLWRGADWMEREVYDMYGIEFTGHPDLRRILMPDEYTSFPLRKDYPLRGRGERHNFPFITRAES
jgi:NADH-quinone oxidoreductase subunit C